MQSFDAIVVGSGFGGLGAALTLVEEGRRVLLLEALNYPGGCASTFRRGDYLFEAGATLFSGFGEGQLMQQWIKRHQMAVELDWLDPVIELRAPSWRLELSSDRRQLVNNMAELPGAPRDGLEKFFEYQRKVADTLWALFDDPALLPPLSLGVLLRHLKRSPKYLPLVSLIGRSLESVAKSYDLLSFEPFRVYLNALSQITVQVSAAEAEATFALAATDYCFRGTAHVRGGIGTLANAFCEAIEKAGGQVIFAHRVNGLRNVGGDWEVAARGDTYRAPLVFANLLPQNLTELLTDSSTKVGKNLLQSTKRVEEGWGAAMLYLGVEASQIGQASPHHLELVADPTMPFMKGNHLFCSVSGAEESGRAPQGERTVTVSTHVPMKELLALSSEEQGGYIQAVQEKMRGTLSILAPELHRAIRTEMPASPRTFERFTRRKHGYVGGIPRRVGLRNYQGIFPEPILPGLYLVGDSNFPGQSTLATAVGGQRAVKAALRR
ncbi:MAG: NAD(P)/FAD-dependent oxidoreductase [Polyangiaceae bacterium]|nr:NAD(P)/FAD-dependent oxidoreductase [Polyangiaceae bacterium]